MIRYNKLKYNVNIDSEITKITLQYINNKDINNIIYKYINDFDCRDIDIWFRSKHKTESFLNNLEEMYR